MRMPHACADYRPDAEEKALNALSPNAGRKVDSP